MIQCNDRPALSSRGPSAPGLDPWGRPGPGFAMGTGWSPSSGWQKAEPVGRCDRIFDAGISPRR